jgi:hypothetical protein
MILIEIFHARIFLWNVRNTFGITIILRAAIGFRTSRNWNKPELSLNILILVKDCHFSTGRIWAAKKK